MKNVVVHDTCEVFLKTLDNDKLYYVGITATSNVNQTIDQTPISGGIGNKRVTAIFNNKNIGFDVTTTLHDDDAYVLQGGADFASGTVSVLTQETVQAVDATGVIKVTITGTPTGGEVTVFDKFGKEYTGAFADTKVSITGGQAGEYYTVVYTITTPSGNILDLDSEKMPKTCSAQLHTIAYDPDTEEIVADIYWLFDKVRGDGAFGAAYAAGTNMQDSMKFNCETLIGSKSYGKYAVIPRATT